MVPRYDEDATRAITVRPDQSLQTTSPCDRPQLTQCSDAKGVRRDAYVHRGDLTRDRPAHAENARSGAWIRPRWRLSPPTLSARGRERRLGALRCRSDVRSQWRSATGRWRRLVLYALGPARTPGRVLSRGWLARTNAGQGLGHLSSPRRDSLVVAACGRRRGYKPRCQRQTRRESGTQSQRSHAREMAQLPVLTTEGVYQ